MPHAACEPSGMSLGYERVSSVTPINKIKQQYVLQAIGWPKREEL